MLERLIEHCMDEQIGHLLDEIVRDVGRLVTHKMGNYVAKSVVEHADENRRAKILQTLLPQLPKLAMHRMGSPVVQKLMNHCSPQAQRSIAATLVHSESPSLADMAANRYGSYVVEELPTLRFHGHAELLQVARDCLARATPQQMSAAFFPRAAARIGLQLEIASAVQSVTSTPDDSDDDASEH